MPNVPVNPSAVPGTQYTSLDLIKSALRLAGVLGTGETPSAAEGQDALVILNQMLDSWNAERLMIYTVARQVFSLVANKQAYTLGSGGDFDTPRPPKIEYVSI